MAKKVAPTSDVEVRVNKLKNSVKRSTETRDKGLMLTIGKKHYHLPMEFNIAEAENYVYVSLNKLQNGIFRLSGNILDFITKDNIDHAEKELKAIAKPSAKKAPVVDPAVEAAQKELEKVWSKLPQGMKIGIDAQTGRPKVVKARAKKTA